LTYKNIYAKVYYTDASIHNFKHAWSNNLIINNMSRNGTQDALQVSMFGAVTDLDTADFALAGNQQFNIKNDGADTVTLEVIPADAADDTFVSTKFAVGWNEEIVRKIKTNAASLTLLWGY